jgi:hypothetical protein
VKNLLVANFTAVVANMIEVNSIAARNAADKFYAAVESGSSVADAVHKIHQLVNDKVTPEEHKASYLSYLAFCPPRLKLNFDPVLTKGKPAPSTPSSGTPGGQAVTAG